MPRARGSKDYVSLAKGLMTEASPLQFPEGYTADELNFLFDKNDGKRVRRMGLKAVPVGGNIYMPSLSPNAKVTQVGYWASAGLVVFAGCTIGDDDDIFYAFKTLDGTFKFFYGTLNVPNAESQYNIEFDFNDNIMISTIRGDAPQDPYMFFYNEVDDTLEVYTVGIYIRDFKLLNDGLGVSERPATLGTHHKYNLYNAGWYASRKNNAGTPIDPVNQFNTDIGDYPSNADIAVLAMKENGTTGALEFDSNTLDEIELGNTKAPRGHYIYNIKNIDRNAKLSAKTADGTPSSTLTYITTKASGDLTWS